MTREAFFHAAPEQRASVGVSIRSNRRQLRMLAYRSLSSRHSDG
jgi:hypothetical protein